MNVAQGVWGSKKLLLCILLVLTACPTLAQQAPSQSKFVRNNDGGTRIRTNNEQELELVIETDLQLKLEVKGMTLNNCQAEVSLDYYQRNTLARVNTKIENKSCASAEGEYLLQLSIRDAHGESSRLDIAQRWQQSQNHVVELSADYPIGQDVELLRVRARNVKCICEQQVQP